jgi:hypothetical protein
MTNSQPMTLNCVNCGGTHIGSIRCPFLPEEMAVNKKAAEKGSWRKHREQLKKKEMEHEARIRKLEAENTGLQAQIEQAKEDEDESVAVIDKLSKLLAAAIVALRGPEPPLTQWSYHDIPERIAALAAENARLRAAGDCFLRWNRTDYNDDFEREYALVGVAESMYAALGDKL